MSLREKIGSIGGGIVRCLPVVYKVALLAAAGVGLSLLVECRNSLQATQRELSSLSGQIEPGFGHNPLSGDTLFDQVESIKGEISDIKSSLLDVQGGVSVMQGDVSSMESDLSSINDLGVQVRR